MTEPSPEQVADVTGAAVAILSAMLADDEPGAEAVAAQTDPHQLAAAFAGMALALMLAMYGEDRTRAELAGWRPGKRLFTGDGDL